MPSATNDFRLSLCVRHPTLPARSIVEIVRRPARVAFSVGDDRAGRDASERHRQSFCKFRLDTLVDETLDQALLRHAARLRWDAPELHRITRTGGDAQLYIAWFLADASACLIQARTLAHLVALDVALAFDLYRPPANGAMPPTVTLVDD